VLQRVRRRLLERVPLRVLLRLLERLRRGSRRRVAHGEGPVWCDRDVAELPNMPPVRAGYKNVVGGVPALRVARRAGLCEK
jgi:hypothetical protein